jgi:hypothetical protein
MGLDIRLCQEARNSRETLFQGTRVDCPITRDYNLQSGARAMPSIIIDAR